MSATNNDEIDQNDDSGPEDVSFSRSKQDTIENLQNIKKQVRFLVKLIVE